jgi:hypothetical protein
MIEYVLDTQVFMKVVVEAIVTVKYFINQVRRCT